MLRSSGLLALLYLVFLSPLVLYLMLLTVSPYTLGHVPLQIDSSIYRQGLSLGLSTCQRPVMWSIPLTPPRVLPSDDAVPVSALVIQVM